MSITAETTILNRVDGSATLTTGATKVITSVTGPIEAKARQELPTTSSLAILIRPDIGIPSTREKLLEDKLRTILTPVIAGELYPRQSIQITVQILHSGESKEYTSRELAAIINSSYLALIDAGVGLNYSFAAQHFSIGHDGEVVVAPSGEDLLISRSSHVVVYDIKNQKVDQLLFSDSLGSFTEDEVYNILGLAIKEVEAIHQNSRETIQAKVEKDFIWQL